MGCSWFLLTCLRSVIRLFRERFDYLLHCGGTEDKGIINAVKGLMDYGVGGFSGWGEDQGIFFLFPGFSSICDGDSG